MESSGEEESVTLCSKIDIKEEPILTDQQPEIEQIYVKEETAKLEIPEDHDETDPLQVKQDECVLDGETTFGPDASRIKQEPECVLEEEITSTSDELPIKQEPEVQIEQESTSCGSEPESASGKYSMSGRNIKYKRLTVGEKLKIIDRLERGESAKKLASEFGVGETTVRDIKKQKEKLIRFSAKCDSLSSRKSMKTSDYENLDEAMLRWFNQKRAEGIPVSGPMCAEQAKFFHSSLGLEGDFNASSGWLSRFKKRYGITEIAIRRERRSADTNAAEKFVREFQSFVEEERLDLHQIYNADETGESTEEQEVSHSQASASIDTLLSYVENRDEFSFSDLVFLRNLRMKIKNNEQSKKQKLVTD